MPTGPNPIPNVSITGLTQLRAALRQVDPKLGPELRKAFNDVGRIFLRETPPWMPVKSGRLVGSLRATSTQTAAKVSEGGARIPYTGWIDFGGKRKSSHYPDIVGRPFRKSGRFLWVTLGKHRDEIFDELQLAVVQAIQTAGLEIL